MSTNADTVEPYVQYAYQLLDQISAGRLRIPKFQRQLVWEWDRQQELLRSIRDGIPMGAVMLWETRGRKIQSQDMLYGHRLGSPPAGNQTYILDGLQRLNTLFAALRGPGPFATKDDAENIFFDLETQDFVRETDAELGARLLPLSRLLSSVDLLRFQRDRLESDDELVQRADELANAFRQYKVPVIPIEGDDLDHVTRTFKLLNSQGTPMDETDMVHALTWSDDFALRDQLQDLINEILTPLGWTEVSPDTILRIIKARLEIGQYDKHAAEPLARGLRDRPVLLREAVESIAEVAAMLRTSCGVCSPALVPYDLQVVLLADAMMQPRRRGDPSGVLGQWFFLTTHGELFAGLSGFRVQKCMEDLRDTVRDGLVRWSGPRPPQLRPLPARRFDFKSARAKGLGLLLARRRGNEMAVYLASHGAQALVPLLTRAEVGAVASSPGNRFLCRPEEVAGLRDALLAGKNVHVEPHLVPAAATDAARRGEWDEFVRLRFDAMMEAEQTFFRDILAGVGVDD